MVPITWLASCADTAARTVPVASTTSGTVALCTSITATP